MEDCTRSESEEVDNRMESRDLVDEDILRVCEEYITGKYGTYGKPKVKSLRLIHGYVFTLETTFRCRNLEERVGGKVPDNPISVSPEMIWTYGDDGKSGDFDLDIKDSGHVETCHSCHGNKKCVQCGGSGRNKCGTCGGSGRINCSRCGGKGLEKCPNCGGRGWVNELVLINCSMCGGRGYNRFGSCSRCGGRGQECVENGKHCPTCGGDGKITCKKCLGKGNSGTCSSCKGTGKVKCRKCRASGECAECGGSGNAVYTWWCTQNDLVLTASRILYDNDVDVKPWPKGDVQEEIRERAESGLPIYESVSAGDENGTESAERKYGSAVIAYSEKNDKVSVPDVFDSLRREQANAAQEEGARKMGEGFQYKIIRQRWRILKIPALVKCMFSMFGKMGYLYVNFETKDIEDDDVREIDGEPAKIKKRKEWRAKFVALDIYVASVLAVVGLPFLFGEWSVAEYLKVFLKPALVMGIIAYLATDVIAWYSAHAWHRAHASYNVMDDYSNSMVLLLLFGVIVPVPVLLLCAHYLPIVDQAIASLTEWFDAISNSAWYYITAVCAIKIGFMFVVSKWKLGALTKRTGMTLLAVVTLALATWPEWLPEGMWLQVASTSVSSVVSMPISYLGMGIYFALKPLVWLFKLFVWLCKLAGWILGVLWEVAVVVGKAIRWVINLFV